MHYGTQTVSKNLPSKDINEIVWCVSSKIPSLTIYEIVGSLDKKWPRIAVSMKLGIREQGVTNPDIKEVT